MSPEREELVESLREYALTQRGKEFKEEFDEVTPDSATAGIGVLAVKEALEEVPDE